MTNDPSDPNHMPTHKFSNLTALFTKGTDLINLGRYEEAKEYYDKALAIDPNYSAALYSKWHALLWLGRPEEAKETYAKLSAIDPNYASI